MGYLNGTGLQQFWRKVKAYITTHTENRGNPHAVTKAQIGLGNVDNTSDLKKPVSTAQQTAMDTHYQQATGYTDTKIAALINGAPSTLDTLGEIATAMQKNENVVNALDQAIGSKASEADFEGHRRDKSNPHSVTKNQVGLGNVPNVSTNDQTPTYAEATVLAELASGEKLSTAFGKLKLVTKNVISLARLIGTTDITGIGNGTVTGALSSLNNNLGQAVNVELGAAGGADKLSDQIYSNWAGIPGSYGCVRFGNGTTMYTGTYIKYSDTIGSMTLTDAGGNVYVWRITNDVYSLSNYGGQGTAVYLTQSTAAELNNWGWRTLDFDLSNCRYIFCVIQDANSTSYESAMIPIEYFKATSNHASRPFILQHDMYKYYLCYSSDTIIGLRGEDPGYRIVIYGIK